VFVCTTWCQVVPGVLAEVLIWLHINGPRVAACVPPLCTPPCFVTQVSSGAALLSLLRRCRPGASGPMWSPTPHSSTRCDPRAGGEMP
jgi:hypothetical protein